MYSLIVNCTIPANEGNIERMHRYVPLYNSQNWQNRDVIEEYTPSGLVPTTY